MSNPEFRFAATLPDINSTSWIIAKVREELGFAPDNIYLNEEDEKQIQSMNDMQREMLILDRNQKAEAAKYKYEKQRLEILKKNQTLSKQQQNVSRKRSAQNAEAYSSQDDDQDDLPKNSSDRSESSYEDGLEKPKKRRLQKGDQKLIQKKRAIVYNPDSGSSSGDSDDQNSSGDDNQKRSQLIQKVSRPLNDSKPVNLQDFLKVVIKRKDMAKWIEHEEYRESLKGAFVRVTYNKQYVVAMIVDFKLGNDCYKVEQRETKWQLSLSSRGMVKQFKLNLVSDKEPQESEFMQMQQTNPDYPISQQQIKKKVKEIQEGCQFQYNKDELERVVNEQNFKKIKTNNFKGLNLTNIRMTIQGELALAESSLNEAKNVNNKNRLSQSDLQELEEKCRELNELMKIISERAAFEVVDQAQKDFKMGAKLVQVGELEEWLITQEHLKHEQQKVGSNIFTYKHRNQKHQNEQDLIQNQKLIEELQRLNMKQDLSTGENSIEEHHFNSFFERIENTKAAVRQAYQKLTTDIPADFNVAKKIASVLLSAGQKQPFDVRQPEHPLKAEERALVEKMKQHQNTITLDEYFSNYYES